MSETSSLFINSSKDAFDQLQPYFNPDSEELWLLNLNAQLGLINKVLVSRGTTEYCLLIPKDILREAVRANATKILIAHNHPSRILIPSPQDLKCTKLLKKACQLLEIPLVDHVIFSDKNYFSFSEKKFL